MTYVISLIIVRKLIIMVTVIYMIIVRKLIIMVTVIHKSLLTRYAATSLITLMVSVDVKHHVTYCCSADWFGPAVKCEAESVRLRFGYLFPSDGVVH